MDTTIKITSLHLVVGIITGIISTGFTLSWFGIKNDVLQPHLHLLYYILLGNLLKNNLEMKSPDFPNGYGME